MDLPFAAFGSDRKFQKTYVYTLVYVDVVQGSVIFYQEGGGLLKIGGRSGTLSKIKRGDQKIFSN